MEKYLKLLKNYQNIAITYKHKFYDYFVDDGDGKERVHPVLRDVWKYKMLDKKYSNEDFKYTRKLIFNLNSGAMDNCLKLFKTMKIDKYGLIKPIYIRYRGNYTDKIKWGEYIAQYGEYDKETKYYNIQMDILENKKDYNNPKECYIFSTHYNGFLALAGEE